MDDSQVFPGARPIACEAASLTIDLPGGMLAATRARVPVEEGETRPAPHRTECANTVRRGRRRARRAKGPAMSPRILTLGLAPAIGARSEPGG